MWSEIPIDVFIKLGNTIPQRYHQAVLNAKLEQQTKHLSYLNNLWYEEKNKSKKQKKKKKKLMFFL